MSWTDIYLIAFPALYAGFLVFAWKHMKRGWEYARMIAEHNRSLAIENVRVVSVARALALRLSPNGHVDLEVEEIEADGEVRIFKEPDHVRVLVK